MEPVNSQNVEQSFKENLNAIINFSDPDKVSGAGIKAINGTLVNNDYKYSKLINHYYYGATFSDTEKLIEKTLNKFLEVLQNDLLDLNYSIDKENDKEKILVQALKFKDDVASLLKLQIACSKIEKAYQYKTNVKEFAVFRENFNENVLNFVDQLDLKIVLLIKKDEYFNKLTQHEELLTEESATYDLESYCKVNSPEISISQATNLILKGEILYAEIIAGFCMPSADSNESQDELAALTWYLMSLALKKGEGFTTGAFMIEDPTNKLYQFLVDSPGHASGIRKSSHLMGRTPKHIGKTSFVVKSSSHHGVDVINNKMPASTRTILFEKTENAPFLEDVMPKSILFFKPESFSPFLTTGHGYDALHHTSEWGISVYNKKVNPGSDDLPTMRKERIPTEYLQDFANLIDYIEIRPYEFESNAFLDESGQLMNLGEAKKNSKLWGIAYMYHFLEKTKTLTYNNKIVELIDNLLDKLTILDHYDKRTGREVYLSTDEL